MVAMTDFEKLGAIKFWITVFVCPIAMVINLLLFYAIIKKSVKAMENYKKVLYLGCITDFFQALWFFFFEPEHIIFQGVFFTITRGIVGYLSSPWAVWVYMPTLFFLYFSLGNALIQFIYRYLMVCWEVKFNKWMFLGLTLLVAAGVAAYPMQYVVYLIQRPTTDEDFTYLLNGSLLDFNGFIPPNGVIEVAVIPVITVVFPICLDILLYLVLPSLTLPWEGQVIFILFSFAPLINPIIKLTIIGCYRKWLFDYLFSSKSGLLSLLSPKSTSAVTILS